MSAELSLVIKEKKTVLDNVNTYLVGKDYPVLRNRLADHYFRAWREEGLCGTFDEAQRRLDRYDEAGVFKTSFIVSDHEKDTIYSLLLTTNIRADSTLDLLEKIPRYRSFETIIPGKDKGEIGFSVCFSITAERGFRVKKDESLHVSLSQFNLFEFKAPSGFYKAAYSRLSGVGRRNLPKFYARNVASPQSLGATGMHENAYGGATLAIIRGSRPEDTSGGRSNTFILLPSDETQREINIQILEGRRRGFVPYEKIGPFFLFKDAWPYLSLAR